MNPPLHIPAPHSKFKTGSVEFSVRRSTFGVHPRASRPCATPTPNPRGPFTLPILCIAAVLVLTLCPASHAAPDSKPNIVYILADDLGYGDVQCLNPEGKILTPNLDRLAAEGMIFTDAHSSSAVCTPTRYGILTGRYNWRSRLKKGVLLGYSPRLIEPDRLTVAQLLKNNGYRTAAVGKWHLGMDWPLKNGRFASGEKDAWEVDYARPIRNGPTVLGFDEFFGISASLDMPPYVYIQNDRAHGIPTTEKKWIRKGPATEDFEAIDVLPKCTDHVVRFIDNHDTNTPFFLYFPMSAPHTPILPVAEWKGRSGLNDYGDFVMQVDATVGRVLEALERAGVRDDTLVIFTSDNGCSPQANFGQLAAMGHDPSYHFRGHKADIFEGGHRIPFIVRWPKKIRPAQSSDQLICLTDLMATCADILDVELPPNAGEDSVSILPALLGQADRPLRDAVVHHSIRGAFSIRQKGWKLELCPGSGGWSAPRPGRDETRGLPALQLYDLTADIGETNNVQLDHPEVVVRLTRLLERYVANGRSTPGPTQQNTGPVDIWAASGRRR